MPYSRYRDIASLTKGEARRLRRLNDQLTEVEKWMLARAEKWLSYYYRICAQDESWSAGDWGDIAIDARVNCVLRRDHPGFDPGRDNTVVAVDAGFFLVPHSRNIYRESWQAMHEPPSLIADLRACRLFQALCCHHAQGDFSLPLQVGALQAEVRFCQVREWGD